MSELLPLAGAMTTAAAGIEREKIWTLLPLAGAMTTPEDGAHTGMRVALLPLAGAMTTLRVILLGHDTSSCCPSQGR